MAELAVNSSIINHIVLMLDASTSMSRHASDLVKVADAQVRFLADTSRREDQETRVTVYTFSSPQYHDGHVAKCLIYDKDVLRMPSIAGLYIPHGNTALCDAMLLGIADLKQTLQKYGDHSFLFYLLTDGLENSSTSQGIRSLPPVIRELPGNWTIAGFVPSVIAKRQLVRYGFPQGNVSVWDPAETGSLDEVGETIATASAGYMQSRAKGVRSVSNLFTMNAPSAGELKSALTPMTPGSYFFEDVTAADLAKVENGRIDQYMALRTGKPYVPGKSYYQMTQRVRIQPYKQVAIVMKDTGDVYVGSDARRKLGLPDHEVRVSPGNFRDYDVFILSTSLNRKLFAGTRVLTMR